MSFANFQADDRTFDAVVYNLQIIGEAVKNLPAFYLLEQPGQKAASPDLVLYLGTEIPRRDAARLRQIDLSQWRPPDLVGEIADTTLASDLDEKKRLYAELKIGEYWVIDLQGQRVIAFRLQPSGRYEQCVQSVALAGLSLDLKTAAHTPQLAAIGISSPPTDRSASWTYTCEYESSTSESLLVPNPLSHGLLCQVSPQSAGG